MEKRGDYFDGANAVVFLPDEWGMIEALEKKLRVKFMDIRDVMENGEIAYKTVHAWDEEFTNLITEQKKIMHYNKVDFGKYFFRDYE